MDMKKKKETIYNVVFGSAYALFIGAILLSELFSDTFAIKIVKAMSLVLFVVSIIIISKRPTKKEILLYGLLIVTLVLSTMTFNDNRNLIFLATIYLAGRGIDGRRFIKYDLVLKALLVAVVFVLSTVGVVQNEMITRGAAGDVRYALGFHHPNFTGLILLNIYMDILVLYRKKPIFIAILAVLLYFLISEVIDSRSASIGVIISTVLYVLPIELVFRLKKGVRRTLFVVLALVPVIVSLLAVFAPMNGTTETIDRQLSGRVSIAKSFYNYYGINFVGNKFERYGESGVDKQFFVLDNTYLYLLMHAGIIVTALFILFYIYRMDSCAESNDKRLIVPLITFLAIGIVEQAAYKPAMNPYLIAKVGDCKDKGKK